MKTKIFSAKTDKNKEAEVLGEKQGIFSRLFGCFHNRLSRPVTIGNVTFQYCSKCGARRQYDIETFKPFGGFYRPKIEKNANYL